MDILCASDLHGDFDTLKLLGRIAGNFDLVIVTGDLTNFSSAKVAMQMISEIESGAKEVLAVPGNCDLQETLELMRGLAVSLHGEGRIVGKIGFFGAGGSNITPFGTPLEYSEDEIKAMLEAGYETVKDAEVRILVSHAPPYGSVDRAPSGQSVGSRAVRDFIAGNPVDLVVCGHIHEDRGSKKLGDTLVINTGPAKKGCVKVTINESGKISHEFLSY